MPPEWLMPVQVALTHRTQYRFERPVTLGPHFVRLRPAPHCRTPISAYALHVTPTALHQLAAGPVRQLSCPHRACRKDHRVCCHGRSDRRDVADQPIRLLRRGGGGALALHLRACAGRRPATLSRPASLRAAAGSLPGRDRSLAALHGSISSPISTSHSAGTSPIARAWKPGVQTRGRDAANANRAPAATPAGCWCRFSAASASPRASSPAT